MGEFTGGILSNSEGTTIMTSSITLCNPQYVDSSQYWMGSPKRYSFVWTHNRAMAICLVYRPVSFLAAPALLIGLLASWSGIKKKN